MKKRTQTILSAMLVAVALGGWAGGSLTTSEEFAYAGGALGAGTGAIIGTASGSPATGAVIGGPVGAVAGYLIGDSLRRALESKVAKKSKNESLSEADRSSGEVTRR